MPPPGKHLVTPSTSPERPQFGPSGAPSEEKIRDELDQLERIAFLAMERMLPMRDLGLRHKFGVNPLATMEGRPYRAPDQSHNQDTVPYVQRSAGERVVEFCTQPQEVVGIRKGRRHMRPLAEGKVRAVTTDEGRVAFPNDGEYLFSPKQRREAAENLVDGLAHIDPQAVDAAQAEVLKQDQRS